MELKITEDMVDAVIERMVEEAVDSADIERRVREAIDYKVREKIENLIEKEIGESSKSMAKEVANDLLSQKTYVDDGWGRRESFDTFADYYRSKLKNAMSDQFINKAIKNAIEERVNREVKEKTDRIKELVAKEIAESEEYHE